MNAVLEQNSVNSSLTGALVDRALAVTYENLPDEIRQIALQCILDWFAVTIAGADEEVSTILLTELREQGGTPEATVLRHGDRLPIQLAALANGTASHALDFDDVNMALSGHASAAVLPAVLALSEKMRVSGAETIAAFVAGYETACRIGLLVAPSHYDRGFHSTATIGSIGAAVGCARLLRLESKKTRHALGIAATQAAGLKSLFGTMCKPLHAGKAAQNGLFAALLARRDFTAVEDVLECRQGFAATQSADFNADAAIVDPLGGYHLYANLFKYHATCYLTHSSIENARRLREENAFLPDAIKKVIIRIDKSTDKVCNIPYPTTGLEVKFSIRHVTAMALAGQDTGRPDRFTDDLARDESVCRLRDRIDIDFAEGWANTVAELTVELKDGRRLKSSCDSGVPASDVTKQGKRLQAKFNGLVMPMLGQEKSERLADAINAFDGQLTVVELLQHCV